MNRFVVCLVVPLERVNSSAQSLHCLPPTPCLCVCGGGGGGKRRSTVLKSLNFWANRKSDRLCCSVLYFLNIVHKLKFCATFGIDKLVPIDKLPTSGLPIKCDSIFFFALFFFLFLNSGTKPICLKLSWAMKVDDVHFYYTTGRV